MKHDESHERNPCMNHYNRIINIILENFHFNVTLSEMRDIPLVKKLNIYIVYIV